MGDIKLKKLTTADYNANKDNWSDTDPTNFNALAVWKLDAGVYIIDGNLLGYAAKASTLNSFTGDIVLVGGNNTTLSRKVIVKINAVSGTVSSQDYLFTIWNPGLDGSNGYSATLATSSAIQKIASRIYASSTTAPTSSTYAPKGTLETVVDSNGEVFVYVSAGQIGGETVWKKVQLS